MGEFSAGEILHGRIFRGRGFPFGGWNFQKNFPSKAFSGMIEKRLRIKFKTIFFQVKVGQREYSG